MSKEEFTDDIDIIQGVSFIKNKEITADLKVIRNNKLTILNHLCQLSLPEGIPPEKKDLKQNSHKNKNSICTSSPCVHL